MDNYYDAYIRQMLMKLLAFTAIVAFSLALADQRQYIGGWLAGSMINLIYFTMLISRVHRVSGLSPVAAVRFMRIGAVLRLFTVALLLIVVTQLPAIHFGATVVGILSYYIVLYIDALWRGIKGK